MGPKKLVVMISGRGSNALAIAEAARSGRLGSRILAAVADRPAAGLEALGRMGLDTVELPRERFPDRRAFENRLAAVLEAFAPDLVVLAGFMRVLSADFVAAHAGRIVNIHPSLLPRHRGLHTHRRVLEAGETVHGASVHFVTAELDAGPVLAQARIPVEADDTAERLEKRLLGTEHQLYPAALALLERYPVEYRHDAILLNGKRLASPLVLGRDFGPDGRLSGHPGDG